MLSWLLCRNGLHKHDFWDIIKSKIRHSFEAHTYLRHIGFARWFQRIESLFGGNWANSPSVGDKCPCQYSHGRERSILMYGKQCGSNLPTLTGFWLTVLVGYNVETKSRTYTGPWRSCWMYSQYCSSHELWATVPSIGAINSLLTYNCSKRFPLTFPAVTRRTFPLWTWEKHGNVRLH